MANKLLRDIARAVGGRMKSVLAQLAKQEAKRLVGHMRERVKDKLAAPARQSPTLEAPAPKPAQRVTAPVAPAEAASPPPKPASAATQPGKKRGAKSSTPTLFTTTEAALRIDLNTASRAELVTLSGVGLARADAIISGRPYATPEELVAKRVIPASLFESIKDRIKAQ